MASASNQEFETIIIRLWGIVQGVGMRPHIARTAAFWHVRGTVQNVGGMVTICASAQKAALDAFLEALIANKPAPAVFVRVEVSSAPFADFSDFTIIDSDAEHGLVMLGADLPVCEICEQELKDPKNERYRHPFISCMACGPRYSIIDDTPYDRCNTAMGEFPMCKRCKKEYTSPADRRFHAQTIACPDCGPVMLFSRPEEPLLNREEALDTAIKVLLKGGLIGVKGTGGYHIACSPFHKESVSAVRHIKRREQKPFAVLFPDIETMRQYAMISDREKELLLSDARPIVLLERKPSEIDEGVFQGSRSIGAFLPSTPFQFLLTEACGALVMTSANVSDQPIITDDEAMLAFCALGLDGVLYHRRGIRTGLDDSVLRIIDDRVQFIRRSRGYVPLPIAMQSELDENTMLFAAGSDLKASFALTRGDFIYSSQPFGDVESEDSFSAWTENIKRMSSLLDISPQWMICDRHPDYRTAQFAADSLFRTLQVQHHHAHIASVMAEHKLLSPVIGIAFDGTGYGTDGTIWGGEFLLCEKGDFTRLGHLKTTSLLGGDNSMREAWKTLLCFLHACSLSDAMEDERLPILRAALKSRINTHQSSSMGRLFDAVCALLNIAQENRYEGECGMRLEDAALDAQAQCITPVPLSFGIEESKDSIILDPSPVLTQLCKGLREKTNNRALALGFHYAVARAIVDVCFLIRKKTNVSTVALSGGVFQNTLLLTLSRRALERNGFTVYQNEAVPPNDGGIAIGQSYVGMCLVKEM